MGNDIEGIELELVISDPWDFVTANGPGPFLGTILKTNKIAPSTGWNTELAALVKLNKPLISNGTTYVYLIISPRHKGDEINTLSDSKNIPCNILMIPEERATSSNAFDLSWWRVGKGGLIGSIKPRKKKT